MNLREFYASIGGNYEDVFARMGNESRIIKYLDMFLSDKNYEMLIKSIEAKDYEMAFISAHTLKGLALNLNFGDFAKISSNVTELLRPRKYNPELKEAIEELKVHYQKLVDNIYLVKGSV